MAKRPTSTRHKRLRAVIVSASILGFLPLVSLMQAAASDVGESTEGSLATQAAALGPTTTSTTQSTTSSTTTEPASNTEAAAATPTPATTTAAAQTQARTQTRTRAS